MKKIVVTLLIFMALPHASAASANGSEMSANASRTLSVGVGSVLIGSVSLAAASGTLVVESVEKTIDGTIIVLRGISNGASEAGKFSVKVAGNASGAASVAVGQSVQVVAESVGYAVIASGEIIAFIPNEIGQSLMHHSRVEAQK